MTFKNLKLIFEQKFSITHLSDIAREFGVTPQVVSNWKARDQVPYKYVKFLRNKIKINESNVIKTVTKEVDQKALKIEKDEITLFQIFSFAFLALKNNLRLFLVIPSLVIVLTLVKLIYFTSPVYSSKVTILPRSNSSKIGTMGIAKQFGLSLGGGGTADSELSSAMFYPDLVKSRLLLKNLLSQNFKTEKYGESKSLLDIFIGTSSDSSKTNMNARLDLGIAMLRNNIIKVRTRNMNPLTKISVSTFEPSLARDILSAVILELERVHSMFKLDAIKNKRMFIEKRIEDLDFDLSKSEEDLKIFRESNRNINKSPALLLEESRYIRDLEVLTELYITLKNEFEQIQLDEVEQSRMFVILDEPNLPSNKSGPSRSRVFISYVFLSLVLSSLVVTIKHWIDKYWYLKVATLFDKF